MRVNPKRFLWYKKRHTQNAKALIGVCFTHRISLFGIASFSLVQLQHFFLT